jgi:hypothetical protein
MSNVFSLGAIVKRREVFFHPVRSVCFIKALMLDPRIHASRKVVFVTLIMAMLAVMLFPGVIEESVLSAVLPVLGSILGIPLDLTLNWTSFALLSVTLLRVFPSQIVNEHYLALVKSSKAQPKFIPERQTT